VLNRAVGRMRIFAKAKKKGTGVFFSQIGPEKTPDPFLRFFEILLQKARRDMRSNLFCALTAAVLLSLAGCNTSSNNGKDGKDGKNGEPGQVKSLDVSFIPEDCFAIAIVHPKRIVDSALGKELLEDVTEEMFADMSENSGVDFRKVEEMSALTISRELTDERNESPADEGFIYRFAEPIAEKEFLSKMFRYIDFADEQATHEGQEYYRGYYDFRPPALSEQEEEEPQDTEKSADYAVHFPDERTVVFSSSEATLKKMLSASDAKSDLVERLRRLDADNDLIIIASTEGAGDMFDVLVEELDRVLPPVMIGLLRVPDLGSTATLTVDLRGDPVAELILEANDAESAAELKKLAENLLAVGKSFFNDGREKILENAPPGVGQPLVELIEEAFEKVTIAQDGQKVTATLARPEALAKLPDIVLQTVTAAKARDEFNTARVQIGLLEQALQLCRLDLGSYPETLESLWQQEPPADLPNPARWNGPYVERELGPDPWGNDYRYKNPGEHNPDSIDIFSLGPDGIEGTDDDIGNWE